MKIKHLIFGERSLTKVAALFATKSVAEDVAHQVKETAGLDNSQVYLVGSPDGTALNSPAFSRKLEPEPAGLLTARPDHVRVITTVRRAIRRGRWAVVIHPVTQRQLDLTMRELRTRSDRVVCSL